MGCSLLETLRAGYEADPESQQAAARLAEHYADLGWYNEALEVYRAALKIHGDDFSCASGMATPATSIRTLKTHCAHSER